MTFRTAGQPTHPRISCPPVNSIPDSPVRGGIVRGLLLINSLSLDAPLVAAIWLWCFSQIFSVEISVHYYLVLISITWLAYAGDRLLDCMRSLKKTGMAPRHDFTSIHFRILMSAWCLVAILSLCFLLQDLSTEELLTGGALVTVLAIYYLLCFYFPRLARGLLPREILVGLFFSTATHVFVFQNLGQWSSYLVWTFLCFWGSCSLNCLLISRCEFQSDQRSGEVTFFTRRPQRLHRFSSILIWYISFQMIACGVSFAYQRFPYFELSMLSSACLLFLLDRSPLEVALKPVLADMALLTPCLLISIVA